MSDLHANILNARYFRPLDAPGQVPKILTYDTMLMVIDAMVAADQGYQAVKLLDACTVGPRSYRDMLNYTLSRKGFRKHRPSYAAASTPLLPMAPLLPLAPMVLPLPMAPTTASATKTPPSKAPIIPLISLLILSLLLLLPLLLPTHLLPLTSPLPMEPRVPYRREPSRIPVTSYASSMPVSSILPHSFS